MKILAAILTAAALAGAGTAATLATTLTLTATPTTIAYGKAVALNGVLSTHRANQNVKVDATECGQSTSKTVGTVKTNATGAFTMPVTPIVNTSYQATQKNTKSPAVAVTVAPVLKLVRVKRGSYTVSVTSAVDLKGKAILFQRYSKTQVNATKFDRNSIMLYHFDGSLFEDGKGTHENDHLSAADKRFMAQMYPKS